MADPSAAHPIPMTSTRSGRLRRHHNDSDAPNAHTTMAGPIVAASTLALELAAMCPARPMANTMAIMNASVARAACGDRSHLDAPSITSLYETEVQT